MVMDIYNDPDKANKINKLNCTCGPRLQLVLKINNSQTFLILEVYEIPFIRSISNSKFSVSERIPFEAQQA